MLWSPNTQLHYPFQNTALDYSGNARNGTVNGSGVYATKPNGGRCLYFDGVGDYVKTPSFGLTGTVMVFAADVRCALLAADYQNILGDGTQSVSIGFLGLVRWINSTDLAFGYANGSATIFHRATNYFLSPYNDTWLNMIVVCDYAGKNIYYYRNGILFLGPVAMSGTPSFPTTNRAKYVGCYSQFVQYLTYGYLANVQLWTLATMPAAAQMLANANRIMLGMNPIW
jgi:hypothetical protein